MCPDPALWKGQAGSLGLVRRLKGEQEARDSFSLEFDLKQDWKGRKEFEQKCRQEGAVNEPFFLFGDRAEHSRVQLPALLRAALLRAAL